MPPMHFWFNLTVVYAVLSFIFSTIFAFVGTGIKFNKKSIFLFFIAIILVFFTAFNAAQQEQKNYDEKLKNSNVMESFDNLNTEYGILEKYLRNIAVSLNLNSTQSTKVLIQKILNKISPRDINPNTAEQIIQELKLAGNQQIIVNYLVSDNESFQYATKLIEILTSAGWKVFGPIPVTFDKPMTGLRIEVQYQNFIPPAANLLASVLNKHGIPLHRWHADPKIKSGSFELDVGSKSDLLIN